MTWMGRNQSPSPCVATFLDIPVYESIRLNGLDLHPVASPKWSRPSADLRLGLAAHR
jgi:hypothetical protein